MLANLRKKRKKMICNIRIMIIFNLIKRRVKENLVLFLVKLRHWPRKINLVA